MTFSFKQFSTLKEAVSTVTKTEFIDTMTQVYDSGDERLVRSIMELGSDIQIADVLKRVFATKLPKAESGAEERLASEIKKLGITPEQKLELAYAIESGAAYDIIGLMNKSVAKSAAISSCVNSSVKGASDLLNWLVGWNAKADAGTRGKAATEIFIIACGKNGRTPDKGDCIVDGVTIESKSLGTGFGGEFSISGKQSSFVEPVNAFKSGLSNIFNSKKIKVANEEEYGLGSAKRSGVVTGTHGAQLTASLQKTIDILMKEGKMTAKQIDSMFQKLINDSFPAASGLSLSVMSGKEINTQNFMVLWNAAAFAEYKSEEGFDVAMFFNRKAMQVISFKTPQDIIKMKDSIKPMNISYKVGIGQNKSIGGFEIKA